MRKGLQQHVAFDLVEAHADTKDDGVVIQRLRHRSIRARRPDGILASHHIGTLHRVAQLTDIARPRAQHPLRKQFGRQVAARAVAFVEAVEETLGQRRDVFATFAQRRQLDRKVGQAVVKVRTQYVAGHRIGRIAIGRRDDAHINRHVVLAAEAGDHAVFQRTQQVDLQLRGHLGDFVEEQGAALGAFEVPGVRLRCAREGAAFMTEQLAAEQVRRDRTAVDRDELAFAPAAVVDRARDQFLAGAALAMQEHGHVVPRDPLDVLEQRDHRRAVPDHAAELVARGRMRACVQARTLEQPVDGIRAQRLDQIVDDRQAHRAHRRVHAGMAGDDGDLAQGRQIHLVEQLHAVSIGQVQIENGQIEIAAARQAAGLAQGARAAHRTVAEHREIRQQRLELEVVIDDKNPALALAHTRPPGSMQCKGLRTCICSSGDAPA